MKKILLTAVVALTVSAPAYAASGSSSQTAGAAAANIVTPIMLTHVSGAQLNFGSFTTGSGTVVVDTLGAGSATGSVNFVPGSTTAKDSFTVTGDKGRSFAISTTGGTVVNGSVSISFTTTPSTGTSALDGTGNAAFDVGGTLTLTGTETAGAYTGTYNATVTYN